MDGTPLLPGPSLAGPLPSCPAGCQFPPWSPLPANMPAAGGMAFNTGAMPP